MKKLLTVCLLTFVVSALQAANLRVLVHNSTAGAITLRVYYSDEGTVGFVSIGTTTLSAGGTYDFGGPSGSGGFDQDDHIKVMWAVGSGVPVSLSSTLAYAHPDEFINAIVSPTYPENGVFQGTSLNTMVFDTDAPVAPVPEYRFDLVLRNDTYANQTYSITTNAVAYQTTTLAPGNTLELSFRNVTNLFPVAISNDGKYPVFSASFAASPGLFWTLEDDVSPVELVAHVMNGNSYAPTNSLAYTSNLFSGLPGGTNAATDGSVQRGFSAMLGAALEEREETSELLRQIATNTAALTVTNSLSMDTNDISMSDVSDQVFLNSGFISASNSLGEISGSLGALTNFAPTTTHLDDFWILSMAGVTVDLNIEHNEDLMAVADFIRNLITWSACAMLLYLIFIWTKEYSFAQGAFHRGKPSSKQDTILSGATGGGIVGLIAAFVRLVLQMFKQGLGFVVVAAISTAFVAIFVAYITGSKGFPDILETVVSNNPLATNHLWIAEGLWLLDKFVDVPALIMLFVLGAVYNLFLAIHALAVQLLMRATPGAIVFAFLQFNVEAAADLQVLNQTGGTVLLSGSGIGSEIHLDQASVLERWNFVGTEFEVRTNSGGPVVTNWQNAYVVDQAKVRVTLGADGAGGVEVIEEATGTVWEAFWAGVKVGGIVMSIALITWLARMLRPTGEQAGYE